MKNIGIVSVMTKCAVLCAVLIVGACEPTAYACIDGTLVGPNTNTGIACSTSTPYTCANGTAAPGATEDRNAERCAACDDGYHMDEGNLCQTNVYACANGTIESGAPAVHNTERCTACTSGFIFNASRQCRPPLTPVQSLSDSADLRLDGSLSIATVTVGGKTFLVTTGFHDDGISVLPVGADGVLAAGQSVSDNEDLELDGANYVATAVVEGTTYLFVAGYYDDGISVFSIGADGKPASVDNVADNASLLLDGVVHIATATMGGVTYLFAAGAIDDGVSVFSVGANGKLTPEYNIASTDKSLHPFSRSGLGLDAASSVATATMGDTTYLFAGAKFSNVVHVYSVNADGASRFQTLSGNIADSREAILPLDTPVDLTTAVVGTATYLFVATLGDGVSVYSVAENGLLALVDNGTQTGLTNARSVTTAVVGETTYLFAAGFQEDRVSVSSVGSDGRLTLVKNVSDSDDNRLLLDATSSVATATIGSDTYLFVAGAGDDGVTVFGVGK